tara:strand:- start:520 stop:918 length:399 start_codon:yes stop_codon:yes gene_type:complete
VNLSEVELPSNRKFGIFFTAVCSGIFAYSIIEGMQAASYSFGLLTSILLLVTIIKADLLLPLNKLWMRFGFLLGVIVSPVVLGVIFYTMFTPLACLMRLRGRDELNLRLKKRSTYWVKRGIDGVSGSFEQQF